MNKAKNRLAATIARMEGAYALSTIRAYRADFNTFIDYCDGQGESALPASQQVTASFVAELVGRGWKAASITRALGAVASIHTLNSLPDPTKMPDARLAIRRMKRTIGCFSRQAAAITDDIRDRMLAACDRSLRGLRDRAILILAYDTLCRRGELVSLELSDLTSRISEKTGTTQTWIHLRCSKVDQDRRGRYLPLSPESVKALREWIKAAKIKEGKLFRGVLRGDILTDGFDLCSVNRAFKRVAKAAGLDPKLVAGISGHSTRVGAAQDLVVSGKSLPMIMHMGRWTKPETVMRYVERVGVPE